MKTSSTDAPSSYDIAIVGGGVSGTSLFYTLATYSTARRVVLIEKNEDFGQVNSNARNNSQTLHVGDIETNYSISKAQEVRPAALMVARYAEGLAPEIRDHILFPTPKMILAVGADEARILGERYEKLLPIFPDLQKLERTDIGRIEPKVVEGRLATEPILALYSEHGYAVDYEHLAQSFVTEVGRMPHGRTFDVRAGSELTHLTKEDLGYRLVLENGTRINARVVIMNADAYSLLFAKRLGYGTEFSLIPVAGSFYFSPELLRGKVYTMQDTRLPFAAVHGDPDVRVPGKTRWGPTARFFPVLESRNWATMIDYFRVSGLWRPQTWVSFARILLEPVRFFYLFTNLVYEFPLIGTFFFARQVRKIIPTISARDLSYAKGFGGMRLQRVDTRTHELLLGEGKIVGENIIFNMTPSPGASVCLYNAMRDAVAIEQFLPLNEYHFDKNTMKRDLCTPIETSPTGGDVSLKDTYTS